MNPSLKHIIRFATVSDAQGIARLFAELGHAVSSSTIVRKWPDVCPENDGVLVAEADGQIVGMVTIDEFHVIHRDAMVGRVTALIVASEFRRGGVGRNLLQVAERHLISRGCGRIEIVSNNRYVDAHRFYEHLQYDSSGVRIHKNVT